MTEYLIGNACLADVDFGPAYTGLATVAYKILNADKTVNVDWTTTGVTELEAGTGQYGVTLASGLFTTEAMLGIEWRTADTGGVYAREQLVVKHPPDNAGIAAAAKATDLATAQSAINALGSPAQADDTRLDNLDAAITTRATPADVDVQVEADLAGLQADVTAIKAKTDQIREIT